MRSKAAARVRLGLHGLACLALASCGGPHPADPFAGLILVSSQMPFPAGCNGAAQSGTVYPGSAVEPFLAIDPTDPAHLIGVWQQDRWSNAGANALVAGVSRDGGRTWTRNSAHFSRCTGGSIANGGDYERASDPWVTFSPDGTAYQISVSFNNSDQGAGKAILVSRTTDGGLTWDEPIALARDQDRSVAVDKESITADPGDARLVYAVWDRLEGLDLDPALVRGPTYFTRFFNGAWDRTPRVIHDPGPDAQTIANQIVVLPDGTVVNAFLLITTMSTQPERRVAVQRSTDKGVTWSGPIIIERSLTVGVRDPKNGRPVRAGAVIPGIAADPGSGKLYVVWQDSRFDSGLRDAIALSTSIDGGLTWSTPIRLSQSPGGVAAFTPAVAVSASGRVAVTYYDFRSDNPGNPNSLLTSYWLATSEDAGATWGETAVAGGFDLRTAPFAEGYFVGDYEGLASDGSSFIPFFSAASFPGHSNFTGIYVQSRTP